MSSSNDNTNKTNTMNLVRRFIELNRKDFSQIYNLYCDCRDFNRTLFWNGSDGFSYADAKKTIELLEKQLEYLKENWKDDTLKSKNHDQYIAFITSLVTAMSSDKQKNLGGRDCRIPDEFCAEFEQACDALKIKWDKREMDTAKEVGICGMITTKRLYVVKY